MKNKQNRLNAIRIIISNERIGNQDELLKKLYAQGFELTQATLSRDLKQLNVAKTAANDGSYIYIFSLAILSISVYRKINRLMRVRYVADLFLFVIRPISLSSKHAPAMLVALPMTLMSTSYLPY